MKFRICPAPITLLVIGLVLISLALPLSGFAATPKDGGKLTVVVETDVSGYDAIKGRSLRGAGRTTVIAVMERLFEPDENNELVPLLGLSAKESADGKTWTVALREGVKFHDGTPFNSDAVVEHWKRLLNKENRYRGGMYIRPVSSVEKLGEHEVAFKLKHPWKAFPAMIANDAGFTAPIPSPKAVNDEIQHRSPVGTGPYIFKEWKPRDKVVLVKNPNYWGEDKPHLDEITLKVVPDHETRYAMLASGEADLIFTDRPKHLKKLGEDSNYKVQTGDTRGATILALNTTKPPLDDVRVRQALAYAYDQEMMLKVTAPDVFAYTEDWLGDGSTCSDNGYMKPDLAKAKALLADYGKPVEFEYTHTATKRGKEVGEVLQQMFAKVGVKLQPKPKDFGAIIKSLFGRKYQMSSWIIGGGRDMGPYTFAATHTKSPWNVTRFSSEKVDNLLAEQRKSSDQQMREETLCDIVKEVNSQAPFLYLYRFKYHTVAKNKVMGVPPMNYGAIHLENAWIND